MRITLLQELRRRWWAYTLLGVVWLLAAQRLFGDHVPRLPVLFNTSPSLPYTLAYVRYGVTAFHRGDFIVYAFHGDAQRIYPGLRHQPFFKIIRGVPGDQISVSEREVFVNGESVGVAMRYAPRRVTLEPIEPVVIPPGQFYVQGTSADSFDSRYKLSGLVRSDQILASVYPLF